MKARNSAPPPGLLETPPGLLETPPPSLLGGLLPDSYLALLKSFPSPPSLLGSVVKQACLVHFPLEHAVTHRWMRVVNFILDPISFKESQTTSAVPLTG